MNEGQKNVMNVCPEKNPRNVLKSQCYEEIVTPIRRSTRIRKPKSLSESDKKEVVERNGSLLNNELPKEKIANPSRELNTGGSCNNKTDPKETNDTFFQNNNGEEESFEAMFDDIFEQRYSKTLQSLLPKKTNNDSVKERKFFKRSSLETPKLDFSSYMCSKANLPAEDVSKVFKIISKPNPLSDVTADSKCSIKPLKTYSNKRKNFQKPKIIESFGLPDHPIASDDVPPLMDDDLDITIQDVNEITILDMEYVTEPWIITTEDKDLIPVVEEVRTKSDPIPELFKTNGSFLDFADSFDSFVEPTIFTSSPFNSHISESNTTTCTSLRKAGKNRNKEIDIEAIKKNFKKILNETKMSRGQIKLKKNSNILPKERNLLVSKNSKSPFVSSDISFVGKDDGLMVDNEEFEFSSNLSEPKSDSLDVKIKNIPENNYIFKKRKTKIIQKKLKLSVNKDTKKVKKSEKVRNMLRTSSRKQKLCAIDTAQNVNDILPKKILETECNSQSLKIRRKKSKQTNMKPRKLRSSLQSHPSRHSEVRSPSLESSFKNSTNETIDEDDNKSNCSIKEHNLLNGKKEVNKKKFKSNNLHTKRRGRRKVSEKKSLGASEKETKRVLRSESQNSLEREKPSTSCNNSTENISQQKQKICTSDVTITLEKYKIKSGMGNVITQNSVDAASNMQEILQKEKNEKLFSPLKKGKKSVPEIMIILNPLDMSKLSEKLPERAKKFFETSPDTSRNTLRLNKTTSDQVRIDHSKRDSYNEFSKEEKKTLHNSKSVAGDTNKKTLDEPEVNERVTTTAERKKSSEIEEKIIKTVGKKDLQKNSLDVKSRKRDSRCKGENSDRTVSENVSKNKGKTKCVELIDCLKDTAVERTKISVEELEVSPTTECQREISNFSTAIIEESDLLHNSLNNTDLIACRFNDEENNLIENVQTNDETRSLENQLCDVLLKNIVDTRQVSECCDSGQINSSEHTIFEKNDEPEHGIEVKSNKTPRKVETKNENMSLECNTKDQTNLEVSNSCKCTELQKICELKQKENLNTVDLVLEKTKICPLNDECKNNISETHSTEIEKASLSGLLKKEEDKILLSTPIADKMESTEYLHNNVNDEKVVMAEYKSSGLSPDSKTVLKAIPDKSKIDAVKEGSESVNIYLEGTPKEKGNVPVENSNETQVISNTEPQDQELEIPSNNEKENVNPPRQDVNQGNEETREKQISCLDKAGSEKTSASPIEKTCEKQIPRLDKADSEKNSASPIEENTCTETAPNKLIPSQNSNVNALNETVVDSKVECNSSSPPTSENKSGNKSENAGKHLGCRTRLKEKRRKLLGAKAFSTEESLRKSENAPVKESNHVTKIREQTTSESHLTDINSVPLGSGNKHESSKKPNISENFDLPQKSIKHIARGRPPRRKSLDDMDLLNRYKVYCDEKMKRSKSVARSALEIKRKSNDEDRLEDRRNCISSFTRNKVCEEDNDDDDIDLLSRYKRYLKTKMKNKNIVENTPEIEKICKRNESGNKNWTAVTKEHTLVLNDTAKTNVDQELSDSNIKKNVHVGKSLCVKNVSRRLVENISIEDDFKVGDIAWAQIGSHPFWPCLITQEPGTRYHKKIFQGKRFQRELYHVRFFGDKGRRAWINKQQIILYSNRDDLDKLQNRMKSENKSIPSMYIVKTKTLPKWEHAIEEVEQLKLKSVNEKLLFFTNMFSKNNLPKEKEPASDDPVLKNIPISLKRKHNEHIEVEEKSKSSECNETKEKPILPPSTENMDEKIQKRYKKTVLNENEVYNDNTASKEDVAEEVVQIQHVGDGIQENENILNKMLLRRQIDEVSEIDSKTSSDNVTEVDTSLNSMEAQRALNKRNNLFKGVSRDKVCQYCYQFGEVLKCRGPCNGSFHVSCSLKILQEGSPKKKRGRRSVHDKTVIDDRRPGILRSTDNPDSSNQDIKAGLNLHKVESFKSPLLTEEEQVQIITVRSSVYNTPPRKTFPPDFKNMTLAEQIDYKMKEIMKKFETKTFYADSCSESSSEDLSGTQALSQVARFCPTNGSHMNINKTAEKKMQELCVNEGIMDDINSISNDTYKLAITKNIDKQIEKKLKLVAKKKLFIKHVTADSEGLKSDIIQEETLNTDKEEDSIEVNPKNFKCGFCVSDLYPYCFICHLAVSRKDSNIRQKCSVYHCGKFYHPECLKMWPQTQWSVIQTTRHKDSDKDMDSFVCPLHVCHTCVSDDPRAATSRCSGDKIVKCLRCPSTYHSSNLCIPAGTAILSSSQIICPRHREKSKQYTINTTWCFLCSEGGNLICCETCPTSVHPECLPVNLTDDDKFICEDCESGRLPLYDEIVWVKLGKFRWWPALILFPNEVPDNIRNMKHNIGEFVVKFFGTYDYYWVNRGRSFLFQEGDTGQCNSVKKKVDAAFNRAVEEAVVAHKLKKEFKLSQEVESITSLKPPPYIRIKVNKPVGNVRHMDLDLSSTNACECDPNKPHPCGPESDCLNRLLLTECNPEVCPAGTRCKNQSFEKREYPPLVPYKTQGRGWGLKTLAPIKKGQFVIEYVGELIDIEEYQRRIQKMHEQKEENYYFLTIDKDRMIDAGPKGNAARFMNHCCQPNCETQKWTVNGDTRVGLFATENIPADTELTFNYNLECVGKEKKVCRCGAPNCSGFIGVKAKQDTEIKKTKRYVKKKVPTEPVVLPPCFVCGKKGLVITCNNKVCNKTYHLKCLNTVVPIEGNKFTCPWHNCNVCSKRTIRCCVRCTNSYCPSHSDGNIRYDNLLGFVCTIHDPLIPPNDVQPIKFKRKKDDVITEETAVTSTTSDDNDDDEDWMPLLMRLERLNSKQATLADSESDNDSNLNRPSASLKKDYVSSDRELQDESTVSSATITNVDVGTVVKRKRGRPKKKDQLEKKIRLIDELNIGNTASSSIIEDKLTNNSNSELTRRHNTLENR